MTKISQRKIGLLMATALVGVFAVLSITGTINAAELGRSAAAKLGLSERDATQVKQIGATKRTPPPDCPNSKKLGLCQAIGKTSAIQIRADGKKFPSRVQQDGKIVGYSVDLGRPTREQRDSLGKDLFPSKHYGAASTVRLSVLSRRGGIKFKLKRQSPTVVINKSMLGRRFFFTLDRPLRVTKGLYVGLTTPSWVTNLQGTLGDDKKNVLHLDKDGNQWLASRPPDKCASDEDALSAHPHQKIGSTRQYGCKFTGARVLYRAYYVPNGKQK